MLLSLFFFFATTTMGVCCIQRHSFLDQTPWKKETEEMKLEIGKKKSKNKIKLEIKKK